MSSSDSQQSARSYPRASKSKAPTLGPGDSIGAGDTFLVPKILGEELSKVVFANVRDEVKWDVMHHRGGEVPRLVAVEGEVAADGSIPIYRHPSDESPPLSPFSPTVSLIRDHVHAALAKIGINHHVNHVLIQYYRSGKDYISEHSDKTIDVVQGTSIINVSLGAERVMVLRTKRDAASTTPLEAAGTAASRSAQRIPLPHASMFVMGLETNKQWLHGIPHDNRPFQTKSPAEQAEGGERISLTLRCIGTFLSGNPNQTSTSTEPIKIYGQGATCKTPDTAQVIPSGTRAVEENEKLIEAFGRENKESDFVWEEVYGKGSDVVTFRFV
ncbi:hypothetical protein D9758_004419 [Tetrapyrgos nigripes]|uniref:Fe2OG dioxygenase domain-containing protein n=1 Tax=Tetrapyrgos nigripes TaxID=182062 RepID=A0A8H5LSM9_9AGAR|nr:hypothetical protein D9758_004419 [Tetrapyrgos nigripes]